MTLTQSHPQTSHSLWWPWHSHTHRHHILCDDLNTVTPTDIAFSVVTLTQSHPQTPHSLQWPWQSYTGGLYILLQEFTKYWDCAEKTKSEYIFACVFKDYVKNTSSLAVSTSSNLTLYQPCNKQFYSATVLHAENKTMRLFFFLSQNLPASCLK